MLFAESFNRLRRARALCCCVLISCLFLIPLLEVCLWCCVRVGRLVEKFLYWETEWSYNPLLPIAAYHLPACSSCLVRYSEILMSVLRKVQKKSKRIP